MKRVSMLVAALVLSASGCENAKSKLDSIKSTTPEAPAAEQPVVADHSGTVEERLKRLEDNWAKHADALDFLGKVYAQQKAQQDEQRRSEPAPDAVFAVDIAQNVKLGMVEGPNTAMVTIVEAWDFA
ncbi:MAG TPA: hypothetical protein VM513_07170 [Kofleriaceae bacterium]|jgi:hypothetical protein|nr:hypothetical protein [Kofleriaceae bacterium]